MRKKVSKLVISFKSNLAAMALESLINADLGRIIPLPVKISAGCGLAFCANPQDEKKIIELMVENNIEYNGIHAVEVYESP